MKALEEPNREPNKESNSSMDSDSDTDVTWKMTQTWNLKPKISSS